MPITAGSAETKVFARSLVLVIKRVTIMPLSMAGTKTSVPLASKGSEVIAGPGQKPESPQPTPKNAAPNTKRGSICFISGK